MSKAQPTQLIGQMAIYSQVSQGSRGTCDEREFGQRRTDRPSARHSWDAVV